jgi:hypothetical protein
MSKRDDIDDLDAEVGCLSDSVDDLIDAVALLTDNQDVAVKTLRRLADINELLTKRVAELEARERVVNEIHYHYDRQTAAPPSWPSPYQPPWEPWEPWEVTCGSNQSTTVTGHTP